MSTVTGLVQEVSIKPGHAKTTGKPYTKYGFQVENEWYSGFRTAANAEELGAVSQGDTVDVAFEVKGDFKNLTGIKVVSKASPATVEAARGGGGTTSQAAVYTYHMRWAITEAALIVKAAGELGDITFKSKKPFDERVAAVIMVAEKLAVHAWNAKPEEEEVIPEDDSGGLKE